MSKVYGIRRNSWWVGALVIMLLPGLVVAAERRRKLRAGEYNPDHKSVDMFKAMKAGDIEVKLIPENSKKARVFIKNKTKEPLNVKLPAAFAAIPALAKKGGVPALAQIGDGGGGGIGRPGGGGGRNSGGSQPMGGGMRGGMGGMGGFMNVPPEKVGRKEVPTVCLAHGKGEPHPLIPYAIKPIEEYTKDARIHAVCAMVGSGKVSQRAAQVAAWHFTDKMSWDQLMAKRLRHVNGLTEPYFSPMEIRTGMKIASAAVRYAKEQEAKKKSKKTDSLSLSQK
jgi:hypothetical protein